MLEEAQRKGVDLVPVLYDQVGIDGNSILCNGSPMGKMDAYYFRAIGGLFDLVNMMLTAIGDAPVVDEYLTIDGPGVRAKHLMHDRLAELDIPTIGYRLFNSFSNVSIERYPCILKYDTGGRRGLGTFLIMEPGHLDAVREVLLERQREDVAQSSSTSKPMLVEEYIPNAGDYRAMVVNYRCVGILKRRPKDGLLVMNTSSGKSKRFKNNRWPRSVGAVAEAAARAMNVQVAGVDLVRHSDTNEIYVIEVNEAPAFRAFEKRTKINVAGMIIDFLMDMVQ
jgi:hypothetical protein